MTIISIIIEFLVSLFKGWIDEQSRNKANQTAGQALTETEVLSAAADRGNIAKENSALVASLSDDDVDKRLLGTDPSPKN